MAGPNSFLGKSTFLTASITSR